MTDQATYLFEELEIIGQGVMAWGEATLRASCPDVDKSQFYVESITFDGGIVIHRKQIEKKRANLQELTLQEAIFWYVAQLLEKDAGAQETWDSQTEEYD